MKTITMRRIARHLFATSALLLAGLQAQAATVTFSPPTSPVLQGATFTIDLVGTGFGSVLDGGGVNIAFDETLVNVTNVAINTALWDPQLSSSGTINNTAGTVSDVIFGSFINRSGDMLFATLTLQALNGVTGTTSLTLTESNLNPFASGGELYPGGITFVAGSVEVSAVPLPATAWFLLTAFAGAGFRARTRRR